MNFIIYGLLLVKNKHIFSKVHFILKKYCKYVLINELYKNKYFNGKKALGINALLLPNYKKHFKAKKNMKEMEFQIHNFMPLFGPPYPTMHLPYLK
jgi:hypothetical protein